MYKKYGIHSITISKQFETIMLRFIYTGHFY